MKKEVAELCPHCANEVTLKWDAEVDGFEVRCPYCGSKLMLCSECSLQKGECDWDEAHDCCSKCKAKVENTKRKEVIRAKAYERFKLWWCINHEYTIQDVFALCMKYIGELEDDCEWSLEEFVNNVGFNGSIWPCFPEFIENEYQDAELMYILMDPVEYQEYLSVEEIKESDHMGNKIKVSTPHGEIVAYDNDNMEHPGISLFFIPEGLNHGMPGGVMEFNPTYRTNDKNETAVPKVMFRFYGKENPFDEPTQIFELE